MHRATAGLFCVLALSGCGERSTVGGYPEFTITAPTTVVPSAVGSVWDADGRLLWTDPSSMDIPIPLLIVETNGMGTAVAAVLITYERDGRREYAPFRWNTAFNAAWGWAYVTGS